MKGASRSENAGRLMLEERSDFLCEYLKSQGGAGRQKLRENNFRF